MKASYRYLTFCLLILAACTNSPNSAKKESTDKPLPSAGDSLVVANDSLSLAEYSKQILQLLKKKRYAELQHHIHPEKGLRFSPYGYINLESDVHIEADQLPALVTKKDKTLWGSYDGSGDDILLTFPEYAAKFIYDVDFLKAEKYSINQSLSSGNTLNNLQEIYPEAEYTESYFSGFEKKYQGMDWKALRLVYEKEDGKYYLTGIIHDQWTI